MKYLILAAFLFIAVVAWAMSRGIDDDGFPNLGVEAFETFIAQHDSTTILDVRTPAEFAEGHLPGAKLIDVNSSDFMVIALKTLPQNKPVAVYCRSGRRSANAARMLTEAGWRVANLKGGYLAWTAEGKPVEK